MMNILVLGNFGYKTNDLNGQSIKTRNVYKILENNCLQSDVLSYFDMQTVKFDNFSIFTLLKKLWQTEVLIYLPAHNNLKYIFPVIFIISLLRKFPILYMVIGGWLPDYLKNKPIHRYMLKRIKHIFPETNDVCEQLHERYDFQNTTTIPNFRIHNFVPKITAEGRNTTLKLVFMARIAKIKGYETIFELAEYIQNTKQNIIIDFYGQMNIDFYRQTDKVDEQNFLSLVEKYNFITYKGVIEPHNVHSTLCEYDVMLFPTKYAGEGFPGTILDAYIAGIPVITTNFPHSTQCVDDNISGYIIPFDDCLDELIVKVMKLYNNREELIQMKRNAYEKSKEYSETTVWKILRPFVH